MEVVFVGGAGAGCKDAARRAVCGGSCAVSRGGLDDVDTVRSIVRRGAMPVRVLRTGTVCTQYRPTSPRMPTLFNDDSERYHRLIEYLFSPQWVLVLTHVPDRAVMAGGVSVQWQQLRPCIHMYSSAYHLSPPCCYWLRWPDIAMLHATDRFYRDVADKIHFVVLEL